MEYEGYFDPGFDYVIIHRNYNFERRSLLQRGLAGNLFAFTSDIFITTSSQHGDDKGLREHPQMHAIVHRPRQ